jgi:hypothetical protein
MTPHEIEQLRLRTRFQTGLILRTAAEVEREIAARPQIMITLGLGNDFSYSDMTNVIPFERRTRHYPGLGRSK